jgi:hypothetical protein
MPDRQAQDPSGTEQADAASVTLSYGPGERGFRGEILSVRLLDGPPPLMDFDLPEQPAGAWLEVFAPGASEPAFLLALPDPRLGHEATGEDGTLTRSASAGLRTAAFEVPWYGLGTRITLRLGDGDRLDTRSREGAFTLALTPDEGTRGRGRHQPVPLGRWGHDNPRALLLLLIGEAFTREEAAAFDAAAEACLQAFEAVPSLRPLLRAFAPMKLLVPSRTSGITHKAGNTPLGARWRSAADAERVILIDERKASGLVSEVAGRRRAQGIAIVNSTRYGGSGGATAVVSRDPQSMQGVLVHELGHSLFGLADEYSAASGYKSDGEPVLPNVSGPFTPATLKWADLVAPGTPVPTPADQPLHRVGAYEGAMYSDHLRYRPAFRCRMRDLDADFCPVCVRVIERKLTPYL